MSGGQRVGLGPGESGREQWKQLTLQLEALLPAPGRKALGELIQHVAEGERQSLKAIRESESLYHSLVDNLPIHVIRKDLDGRIIYANQTFCNLLGQSLEEIHGKTDYDFFPTELADKYRADDSYVARTGETLSCVEVNKTADVTRYFEVRKTAIRNHSDELVATQAIFWDVTSREEARSALSRERDLLRTLMDAIPDYIYVKDVEGKYITANAATMELFHLDSVSELVGRTNFDFVENGLAAQHAIDDQLVLESGQPLIDQEELVRNAEGEPSCLLVSKVPLRDRDGVPTGLVGIDRDISKRKQMEEELRNAKETADAASAAKSQFLANMSHEIRTPMNAVLGITELLLDSELDPTQREYLQMVHESGESLMTVLNDILDFSKIEAGKLQLDGADFDLHEMIGNAMKAMALRAHRKQIELAYAVDHRVPRFVQADAGRLRQIVTNLVGNAIKFTDRGEVVVEIQRESTDEAGRCLHFCIRDTGIGIPQEKLQKIFAAFEQADSSTTRRFGGTGLGLAISVRLIELMGGRIWAESQVGQGSVFHFVLELPEATGEATPVLPTDLMDLKILAVDDNATNRRILVDGLGNRGFDVQAVESAATALKTIRRAAEVGEPIGLVLTDINMPDADGFVLARQIAAESLVPRPVVIALTSGARADDDQRCREAGIAAHLMKPVKQSELVATIARVLKPSFASTEDRAGKTATIQPAANPLDILLAEDSLVNQKLAVGLLSKAGHRVHVVPTGNQAVAAWQQGDFALILMDLQMPEMDGLEATRQIRAEEGSTDRHVPIVAMTAHAMKGDKQRCLDAGMDGYVAKPIRINDVLSEINRLIVG